MIRVLTEPRVWIMPASGSESLGFTYPWDWSTWIEEPRLVVQQTIKAAGATGTASFQVVRSKQIAPGSPEEAEQATSLRAGCYVFVSTYSLTTTVGEVTTTLPQPDPDGWLGILTEVEVDPIGTADGFGTATAQELGSSLLDRVRCNAWRQRKSTGYPDTIYAIPSANFDTQGGRVVGNAQLGTDANGNPAYLFARELSDCGTTSGKIWTPWRLLTHAAQFCLPRNAPPISIRCEDGTGVSGTAYQFSGLSGIAKALDDTDAPEVYELDGLTWAGVLNLLAGPGVGVGWRLSPELIGTNIVLIATIYSRQTMDSRYGNTKPPASRRQISATTELDRLARCEITTDGSEEYDEVIIQGGPIVIGASLSNIDGNLDKAWSTERQDTYASATDEERGAPVNADVFSLFKIKRPSADIGVTVATNPGKNDTAIPLTPFIQWDGSTNAVTVTATNQDQYLPALRILPYFPIPTGLRPDGTSNQDPSGLAGEELGKPGAYYYDSAAAKWLDLMDAERSGMGETPQVTPADKQPGISIAYQRPHLLGLDTFTGADNGGTPAQLDWRKMVVTVAIPSTQRLEVVNRRYINGSEMTVAQVRRSLVIRDESYQYCVVLAGTVIGTKDGKAEAIRVRYNVVTRNDFRAAQRYCNEVSAWALRPRHSATINLAIGEGVGSRMLVGDLIESITVDGGKRTINGIIASISYDWEAGRAVVQTELPPQPDKRGGGSSSSPAAGGQVSVELGGTVAQITQRNDNAIRDLRAAIDARPLIPRQASGGGVPDSLILEIVSGQVLSGGVNAITFAVSVTPPITVLDPNVQVLYPDGIGRAKLWRNGVLQAGLVLVRHDFTAYAGPLIAGFVVPARGTTTLVHTVSVGPPAVTITNTLYLVQGYP